MSVQPLGTTLDNLGVAADLEDNEHLVEAIVIGKLATFDADDNTPRLIISKSEGLDWIAQTGLFHAARAVIDQPAVTPDDE